MAAEVGGVRKKAGEGDQRKAIENQPWYHGCLSREDAEKELKEDGQFLVRISPKNVNTELQPIISCRHQGRLHHIAMKRIKENKWYVETGDGTCYDTIYDLVVTHQRTKTPLNRVSGAVLWEGVEKQEWQLDDNQLRMTKLLGRGHFGEVWLGKYKEKQSGRKVEVAIKKCAESQMSDQERKQSLQEAVLMLHYNHPNVVRIIGIAATKPPMKIVMEFCPAGSLDRHLRSKKGKLSKGNKILYCLQAARGMTYLSSKKCIHRDLAARNCLLGKGRQVKISDFGMSKLKSGLYKTVGTAKVSIPWSAPEVLKFGAFSEASDIFSFGVLMWEIFASGNHPWGEIKESQEIMRKVKNGDRLKTPPDTPSSIGKLMQLCWPENPKDRIKFQDASQWLEEVARQNSGTLTESSSQTQTQTQTQETTTENQ